MVIERQLFKTKRKQIDLFSLRLFVRFGFRNTCCLKIKSIKKPSYDNDTRGIRAFGLCFDRQVVFGVAYVHRVLRATQKGTTNGAQMGCSGFFNLKKNNNIFFLFHVWSVKRGGLQSVPESKISICGATRVIENLLTFLK